MTLELEELVRLNLQAGFGPEAAAIGAAIEQAESSGNPQAVNPASGAAGLWQFMRETWAGLIRQGLASGSPFDPLAAARAAFNLSRGGTDWSDWEAYTSGAYRRYLAEAQAIVGRVAAAAPPPLGGGFDPGDVAGALGRSLGQGLSGAAGTVGHGLADALAAALQNAQTFAARNLVALVVAAVFVVALFL